jgi:hypothetical protein
MIQSCYYLVHTYMMITTITTTTTTITIITIIMIMKIITMTIKIAYTGLTKVVLR